MRHKKLKEHAAKHAMIRERLPDDLNADIEKLLDFAGFHFDVFEAMEQVCIPKLRALGKKHYPDLQVVHPVLEQHITEIHSAAVFGLAYNMKDLVSDMKQGVKMHEKYPRLEEWRDFYLNPKPDTMNEEDRNRFLHPDDDEWAKYVEHENREMLRFFLWQEHRKTEFYDILQPELFKLYPILNDLEGDYWVLYAVNIRDEYELWMSVMEEAETVVQYEMPPESATWEYSKYREEVRARYSKYSKNAQAKRNAMIKSFEI